MLTRTFLGYKSHNFTTNLPSREFQFLRGHSLHHRFYAFELLAGHWPRSDRLFRHLWLQVNQQTSWSTVPVRYHSVIQYRTTRCLRLSDVPEFSYHLPSVHHWSWPWILQAKWKHACSFLQSLPVDLTLMTMENLYCLVAIDV